MKIVSNFIDYYDVISGNKKTPVYNRNTEIIENCDVTLKTMLTRAMIEINSMFNSGDIWMIGHHSDKSSTNYVKIVPYLLGIAGEYHYFIEYYNSVLNIRKYCYSYEELLPYYKNNAISRTFDLYHKGLLNGYCRQQFGCVNFIMYKNDSLTLVREPNLSETPNIGRFLLTSQEIYSKIEMFLIETKALDVAYKKKRPNTPYEITKTYRPYYKKKMLREMNENKIIK